MTLFKITGYDILTAFYTTGWVLVLAFITFPQTKSSPPVWPLAITILISVSLQLMSSVAIHMNWPRMLLVWMLFALVEASIIVGYGAYINGKLKTPYYDFAPLAYIVMKPMLAWLVYKARQEILYTTIPYEEVLL